MRLSISPDALLLLAQAKDLISDLFKGSIQLACITSEKVLLLASENVRFS
jgi:hypothetical protein